MSCQTLDLSDQRPPTHVVWPLCGSFGRMSSQDSPMFPLRLQICTPGNMNVSFGCVTGHKQMVQFPSRSTVFEKKKHFNFKFRDWLPAPALCSLWGPQCFGSFQFQVFVEQNLPSVHGKSYGGYKLFITLGKKNKWSRLAQCLNASWLIKIGHPTLGIPVINLQKKLSFARALWNVMDGDTLGPLKIYVIFHIRARRAGAKNLHDEAKKSDSREAWVLECKSSMTRIC